MVCAGEGDGRPRCGPRHVCNTHDQLHMARKARHPAPRAHPFTAPTPPTPHAPPGAARQVKLLEAGHCPHDEVPEQVNQGILEFVEGRVLRRPAAAGQRAVQEAAAP